MSQLFCADKRPDIKAANPEAGFGDTTKLLAAAWKECSEEEEQKYQALAKVSMFTYLSKMSWTQTRLYSVIASCDESCEL